MTVAKAATIMKCQEKLKQERSTVTVAWGKQHDRHGRASPPIVWAGTTFEAPALRLLGSGGAELPEAREARLCVCAAAVKSIPKFCAFINDMGANPRWTKESARKCMLIYRALEREFLEQNPDCARPPADGLYYFGVDFFALPGRGRRRDGAVAVVASHAAEAAEAAVAAQNAERELQHQAELETRRAAAEADIARRDQELKALAASKEVALEEVAMLKERIAAVEGGVAAHKQELDGLALKIPHEGDGDALNELMMLKSLQCTAFVVKLISETTGEDLFKLCDFGSAREYSSSDVEFTGAGTPRSSRSPSRRDSTVAPRRPSSTGSVSEACHAGPSWDVFAVGVMIYIFAFAQPVGGYDDDSVSFADVIDEFTFVGMWPELTKRLSSEDPDDVYNFLRDDDCDAEEERDAINDAINRDRAQMVAQKVDEVPGRESDRAEQRAAERARPHRDCRLQ
ncbi:hypothetical protein JL720_3146 [Aureococcus anophagefferens]|nr:hypothetical protein JL720_3146 [Aureococcus anophagefferens]